MGASPLFAPEKKFSLDATLATGAREIPSWGTREGELKYSFIEESKNKQYTYYIDTHAFNHIILFPVFWFMFITLDEDAIYRESITNFIESAARDTKSDSQ